MKSIYCFSVASGILLALDRLLQHVHQVHGVGGHFLDVEIEGLRQHLEGEAGGDAVHALVDARDVAVFLHRLGLGVDVLQVLAVIDPHLGEQVRVLVLLEARQHAELREHVQRARRARRHGEVAGLHQLLVDLRLLVGAQAIGHLHHADAVDEGLVVLVVLEALPFGLVRVRQHDALVGDRAHALGADIVVLLRRGQQRMQHLDRRLEHLDELEQALGGQIEGAAVRISVRIVLAEELQLADVDLADQGRNVLVVLVARLGLGDADLLQLGRDRASRR